MGPEDMRLSKSVQGDPLFLEMELEHRVEGWTKTAKLEALMVGLAKLGGAIWAQTVLCVVLG